ncbi:MAG: C45 family autoproteolytic acyltransferase/hydrolase [Kordiimonas sp.]
MTRSFPRIEVGGSSRDRGVQYGEQAKAQIAAGVGIYRESFAKTGSDWSEACELAQSFLAKVSDYDQDFLVEIEGIAAGAQQPVAHIIILNARTELQFWKNKVPGENLSAQEECTAALAMPSATANGHLLHGQNWDWNPRCAESGVVLCIRSETGPDILTFVEAGQLARSGMNSAGIALTANGLHSSIDYGRVGIPNPFMRRRLLMQDRLAPALYAVTSADISFSHFLLISHAGGEAVGLETTPEHVFWDQPTDGVLTHANHFKTPGALAQLRDISFLRTPETLYRDSRTAAILEQAKGQISRETFIEAFSDTYGAPDSVLRSPAVRPGGVPSATVASIIMDTTDKKMWISAAPYEGNEYVEYGF